VRILPPVLLLACLPALGSPLHRTYGYNGVNYRTSETRFDDNGL